MQTLQKIIFNLLKLFVGYKFTRFMGMVQKRKGTEFTLILMHTIGPGSTGCEGVPAIGLVG